MRYLDRIIRQLATSGLPGAATLRDNMQRIILDVEQAAVFWNLAEPPPPGVRVGLMMPFQHFWLEFTLPLRLESYTEGGSLSLVAIMATGTIPSDIGADEDGMAAPVRMTTYFSEGPERPISNMTFSFDLASGLCRLVDTTRDLPKDMQLVLRKQRATGLGADHLFEDLAGPVGELFQWLLCYMMAKSIVITEESLPRQQRRLLARKGLPTPWHVVKVDPVIVQAGAPSGEPGAGHGYRYDVMGHLRFGRHKRGDGTYSETVEWVRPHQRGLRHQRYIPKTASFSGDRTPDARLRRWWGQTKEQNNDNIDRR